ncbi:MAG TPA: VWA domain-containing protein, partial [Vicinamibacteria bacterium]
MSVPRSLLLAAAFWAAALAPAAPAPAAQSPDKRDEVPTFGTSTEMVYVRFHVEKKGGYVDALSKDQLRVLEDGRPQKIALLETPSTRERTIPPEVTLALDVSSSVMDERLLDESLVKEVLFASLSEQARVGLCAFGGELRCLRPPTRDADSLVEGFQEALRFGWETRREGTRLYASLADICRRPKEGEKAQRAMIVFSDGLENRGGKVGEAIQAAAENDVRVYSVLLSQAFQTSSRNAGFGGGVPNRTMYDYKKFELGRLAEETGGQSYEPGTLDEKSIAKILRSIATQITMENVVGYQPEGAATGRKRHVKVELVDKSAGS